MLLRYNYLVCHLCVRVVSLNQDAINLPCLICQSNMDYQPFYGKDNKRNAIIHWNAEKSRLSFAENVMYEHFIMPPLPAGTYYVEFLPFQEVLLYNKITCKLLKFPLSYKINFKIE